MTNTDQKTSAQARTGNMDAATLLSGDSQAEDCPVLTLSSLHVEKMTGHGRLPLVRDVTLSIRRGEIVCLVGESGSGKSVTARTIMGLTQRDPGMRVNGSGMFGGVNLFAEAGYPRHLQGREIAMIFQESSDSLDPVFTIESQLAEALKRRDNIGKREARPRLGDALREVGIHDVSRVLRSYPHQLSGGMCQRIMIAMALLAKPQLLIADEPTTALDVTIQSQILDVIERLRDEEDMAVLLVTHDMGVAAQVADRVAVMYAGEVVELDSPTELFAKPRHPYTAGLLGCVPTMGGKPGQRLDSIEGSVPAPGHLPAGCAFHPRCPRVTEICRTQSPDAHASSSGFVKCWNEVSA